MIDFIKLRPGKFYYVVELQFIFNEESLYFLWTDLITHISPFMIHLLCI